MYYLSQLLGASVEDANGVRIGKICDILVFAAQVGQSEPAYPAAILIEGQAEQPWRVSHDALQWHKDGLRLTTPLEQFPAQADSFSPQEVSLAQEVLDKQVIDIARKKAVRVNDVCLDEHWHILGIDNSTLGLVRRLAPSWLLGTRSRYSPGMIPWERVELIGSQRPEDEPSVESVPAGNSVLPPRVPSGHLAELRPADIAEIVHHLTPGQGARLIERLDDEIAADTMEEIDTDRQRHILENIQAARAADILEAMEPDEVADLLAHMPEERAQELLRLMTPEESEDVQELLEYEEDSAGGLMTTDFIVLDQTRSAAEALDTVRSTIQEQDIRAAYIYCVADETQDECVLQGVVSLWDLLVAVPTQTLQTLMETDLITVLPDTDGHTVAQIMAKYNLLAVPVVGPEGFLEGVVTVDDALDVLLPQDRRRKPPRMY